MTGRLVFTEKAEDKSTLAIYLSAPAGMYIASVITEEGIHTVKIVKD